MTHIIHPEALLYEHFYSGPKPKPFEDEEIFNDEEESDDE